MVSRVAGHGITERQSHQARAGQLPFLIGMVPGHPVKVGNPVFPISWLTAKGNKEEGGRQGETVRLRSV